jgi:hypothetical protein
MNTGEILLQVAALLLSLALGLSFIRPLFDLSSASAKVLWLALGWTFGTLLSSAIWFFLCIWPAFPPFYALSLELILAGSFWFFGPKYVFRKAGMPISGFDVSASKWERTLLVLAALCFLFFLGTLAIKTWMYPYGIWDAWAIWNLHARVLYRDQQHWRVILPLLRNSHPDYPIFQPITVARLWYVSGSESPSAPILVQFAFATATVFLVAAGLAVVKSTAHAAIAAIFLLGTTSFIELAHSQYADITVGLLIAACFVLLVCYRQFDNRRLLFLGGLAAGGAAWVKNEGNLFLLSLLFVGLIVSLRSPQKRQFLLEARSFAYGLILPLFCTFLFKRLIGWHSDAMTWTLEWHQWQVGLTKKRVWTILKAYWSTAWKIDRWAIPPLLWLLLLIDTAGVERSHKLRRDARLGLTVLGLMLLGYVLIYATSAQDLHWYLESSLERLLLQMWPAFIFLVFLLVKAPMRPFGSRFGTTSAKFQNGTGNESNRQLNSSIEEAAAN